MSSDSLWTCKQTQAPVCADTESGKGWFLCVYGVVVAGGEAMFCESATLV